MRTKVSRMIRESRPPNPAARWAADPDAAVHRHAEPTGEQAEQAEQGFQVPEAGPDLALPWLDKLKRRSTTKDGR